MKKKSIAKSSCSSAVRASKTRVLTRQDEERYQLDSVRPARYHRATQRIKSRLRKESALGRVNDPIEPPQEWSTSLRVKQKKESEQLNSLEVLSYQARFSTLVSTRKEALEGMVTMDRFAEATLQTLEEALDDPVPEMRAKAAELLKDSPPSLPERMLDKLIARAWDPELIVRRAVAAALANHPDPRAIGPLMGLLGTQDDELREIVHQSLIDICTKLGPPPPRTDGDT